MMNCVLRLAAELQMMNCALRLAAELQMMNCALQLVEASLLQLYALSLRPPIRCLIMITREQHSLRPPIRCLIMITREQHLRCSWQSLVAGRGVLHGLLIADPRSCCLAFDVVCFLLLHCDPVSYTHLKLPT